MSAVTDVGKWSPEMVSLLAASEGWAIPENTAWVVADWLNTWLGEQRRRRWLTMYVDDLGVMSVRTATHSECCCLNGEPQLSRRVLARLFYRFGGGMLSDER